jgi:hypothetical protein
MSQSTQQTPEEGLPPTTPPPKPKRQFLVTKIAVGVAAGIALFLIGSGVLIAVLLAGGSSGDKHATATAPVTTEFIPPPSAPPDTTPDMTAPPTPVTAGKLAIGETGSFTSEDGSAADITITKVEVTTRDPSPYGERAKHGFFVVFHVKTSGTSGGYDVNTFDFYATSSNGYHTEEPEYLDSWGPTFEGGTVHEGEHQSGTIVYDLPTRHGKLVYSPNFDNEALATWSY